MKPIHQFLLLLTSSLTFLLILFIKKNSPFGWVFWLGLYGFVISCILLITYVGLQLIHRRKRVLKFLAVLPFLCSLLLLLFLIFMSWDYRFLLPITTVQDLSLKEYKEDLYYFHSQLKSHPNYTSSIEAIVNQEIDKLHTKSRRLDRDELVKELMKLIGLFKDGHSFLLPFQVYNQSRYFPLTGYYFDDGFFILTTSDEYQELKHKKLLKVNGVNIDTLFHDIKKLVGAENEFNAKSRLNYYLFSENILRMLGIVHKNRPAIFTYLDDLGKVQELKVQSEPFANWIFWALKPMNNPLPIFMNVRKPNYQLHHHKKTLIVELNLIENESDTYPITKLAVEIDSLLKSEKVDCLIIDLRNNTGGNNQLYHPIIKTIKANNQINTTDDLFVWMGRNTFSAGINFLDELQVATKAITIGEPTGAAATHFGDAKFHFLPNSGIAFFMSTKQWHSKDRTASSHAIFPNIPVSYHFKDYQHSIDPWMNAVKLKRSQY